MTRERDLARPRVRRLRRGPAALARAGRTSTATRCSTSAPAPAGSRSTSPRRGHEVIALDIDPRAARRARAPAPPALTVDDGRRPTRATSTSDGGSRCASCRCRRSSCSAAPTAAPRSCAARAAHLRAGGVLAVAIADDARAVRGRSTASPRRCPTSASSTASSTSSQPTAVRADGDGFVLERRRERITRAGDALGRAGRDPARPARRPTSSRPRRVARRAARRPGARAVAATDDYVGSEVVMLACLSSPCCASARCTPT